MKRISLGVLLIFLGGCHSGSDATRIAQDPTPKNLISNHRDVDRTIGDESNAFRVLGERALAKEIGKSEGEPRGLTLAFPKKLLGQQFVFGGVITKVSDTQSENMGNLKLTDLTPIHVRAMIAEDKGQKYLVLVGCLYNCSENSQQELVLQIPILGETTNKEGLLIDLANLGTELDIMGIIDPGGTYTKLKTKSSQTTTFDYSFSTLVFDVESAMIPVDADPTDPSVPTKMTVTARWYLKMGSDFNPAFVPRLAASGVGYFMTERGEKELIRRFSTTQYGDAAPVRYFIKNVPAQWQKAFAASFDEWNEKFRPVIGHDLIQYQFVDPNSPLNSYLVPGDIRFNIMEWDLENKAGYGGLGPSISNQFTGEHFNANVLIQGPTIMKIYKEWFKVGNLAATLRTQGNFKEAERVIIEFKKQLKAEEKSLDHGKWTVKLGKKLTLEVPSQRPELQDPLFQRIDFDETPSGYDFESYMNGYFIDMVAHELGHNIGLRHNFRGNLGAKDPTKPSQVSRSIMEYLNKSYRHLDHLGEYDEMAIAYGYKGTSPNHVDWFCTDDNVVSAKEPQNSAECSRDDATNDPFSYYEARLSKVISKLTNQGSVEAPEWSPQDMAREMGVAVVGLISYPGSATATAEGWTNFFGKLDRPQTKADVKDYVLGKVKGQICSADIEKAIAEKNTEEGKQKVRDNIKALRDSIAKTAKSFRAYSPEELACQ